MSAVELLLNPKSNPCFAERSVLLSFNVGRNEIDNEGRGLASIFLWFWSDGIKRCAVCWIVRFLL